MNHLEFNEADPHTVRRWVESGEAVLIDIREPDEHARVHIAGATLAPLSRFQPTEVPGERSGIAVFHCASGNRTSQARTQLLACGFAQTVHLAGGITAWQHAGLPTVVNRRAPLPIQRQVQVVAGALIVLSVVLGSLVSPWWLSLAGFVGAGLVFAGVSGWCGMGELLAKMPWNRRDSDAVAPPALETS